MRKILICSHGHMASGIKSSVNLILGKINNLFTIDAYVDEINFEKEVKNFFDKCDIDDEIIILTDISKGSVNQHLYCYLKDNRVRIITGINLALVLSILTIFDDKISDDILNGIVEECRKEIIFYNGNNLSKNKDIVDDLFDE